jgi:hypothetical protein
MWNDGLHVKELTLPLLLVSGYSAVSYLPAIIDSLNAH